MSEHTPAPTPARSLYGFFMYLSSKIILAGYCIWAFTPDSVLHYLNIYYYPQKYWATAVPIQCLVGLTIFAFFMYPSSNLMLTSNIDAIHTVYDHYNKDDRKISNLNCHVNNYCICKDDSKCMKNNYLATSKEVVENTIPKLKDLDISFVSRKLYLNSGDLIRFE